MKKIDVTGVPAEMVEALFGDERLIEGDEVEVNLERLVETATGVSLSPYSQEKMMLSDQISVPSSNAPMFEDIFGEQSIGADQTASVPQSSFIRTSEITLDNHTRFVPDPTPLTIKPAGSLYNRIIEKVSEMASQDLSKTKTPSDFAILTGTEGLQEPLPQDQLAKRKNVFGSLVVKMRKSRSLKFLMDKIQQGDFLLTEKESDELDRLRIIDTEIFDCAFPPSL